MTENKIDQHSLQDRNNSIRQSTQRNADLRPDETIIEVQEIEEWDVIIPDQRRPQFRSDENYSRRNY
ncbi:MAG: hypothetical protein ABI472_21540 [Ginsengibacter sp.]